MLPVRLMSCGPSVGLSFSVKNSVDDPLPGLKHQISYLVLVTQSLTGRLGRRVEGE